MPFSTSSFPLPLDVLSFLCISVSVWHRLGKQPLKNPITPQADLFLDDVMIL